MKKKYTTSISILALMTCGILLGSTDVLADENSSQNQSQIVAEPKAVENYWQTNFQNGQLGNWQDLVGGTNRTLKSNALDIFRKTESGNNAVSINLDSPQKADGEIETSFKFTSGEGRTGVVVRGASKDSWIFIGYNVNGKWLVESPTSWNDNLSGPTLVADTTYVLKVRYVGTKITIWLNGTQFYDGEPVLANGAKIPTTAGRIGFRTWYDQKSVTYQYFKNGDSGTIPEIIPEITEIAPSKIFTKIGVAPILPTTVKTTYNTGIQKDESVSWDPIAPESYQKVGSFDVLGTVTGTALKAKATITVIDEGSIETGDKISSADLTAVLDPKFPRVIRYENPSDNKIIFKGQQEKNNQVLIDGKPYEATAVKEQTTAKNKAIYQVTVPAIDLSFKVSFTISDGLEMAMKITDIKEGTTKIHTLAIANQGMLSVNSTDAGAAFSGVVMNTGTNANNNNKNGDTFQNLVSSNEVGTKQYMYGFLNTNDYAASFWTNAYGDGTVDNSDNNRIYKQTKETAAGYVTSLWSGSWTYRPFDAPNTYLTGDIPEVKVKFAKDLNGDGKVDWQDAAISYRAIMNNPVGAEKVPELVNQRIPFNFASQATNPFSVTLDESKRVYNLTDGLGQMNLLKGYQNEGHDSAHPDYGEVGKRQGGVNDLNQLIEEGHKLNAIFGVHVNDTESYPEAKHFSEELVDPTKRGWDWLDPSYFIKQRPDTISGNRLERFKELKQNVPKLDYIYVDVWGNQGEAGWLSRQLSKEINGLGWITANEFPNALEYDSIWNHWSAEKAYGGTSTKGFNSNIVRFIRNHQKDTWIISDNPLLGGAEFEAYEGWVGKTNFNTYKDKTFAINIPTKFLQHYQITNWDTTTSAEGQIYGTIKLASANDKVVVTKKDASDQKRITLNNVDVLKGSTYLLPWTVNKELKLYHWNETGGSTTWTIPDELQAKTNLHVYELTDQGRKDKGAANITGNQVTIQAAAKTPYIIAEPATVEPVKFGTGTPVKDPGFNEQDTLAKNWQVIQGDATVIKDPNGDYVLNAGKAAMTIKQDLTVPKAGKYSAYVNTETHNRKASITMEIDGKKYTKDYTNSVVQNYIQADINHTSSKYPQYMQNARVDFVVPENAQKVTLTLAAEAGTNKTKFDDIRIVERQTDVMNPTSETIIKQDFEDTQAIGLFPFVKGQAGGVEDPRIHLSEKNEPYTQYGWNGNKVSDVLSGNWSLKAHKQGTGLMLQTTPQNIKFEAGKKYTVSFDYQTDGKDIFSAGSVTGEFKSLSDLKKVGTILPTSADGKTKKYEAEITGDASGNTTFGIYTTGGAYDLVIDNFTVTVKTTK
ncbi:Ig-like domain (group 4) family protein [Enterococcus haemoperoxidus ATCC BAA-382]|uniref:Ig-like domain (Group 4) family protein n=1 Tax=Enterococcus haemoperoxidus ATCC BAA-382 TaxID=1158608 RepID=R2SPH2_9ENTE|nr:endo-alpha-N-acetylgalactosaminidase family protein [Enterococcus haemoperoxidus]EOH97110.1 Ig-like domain (group 4) family protein [Enterococcus haemoperoxidus ATCC BAA-382]EOT59923.1 Ig-like domain (group 4) family protein [Enterococcus haemoperoxidus ATCC BAA-382]